MMRNSHATRSRDATANERTLFKRFRSAMMFDRRGSLLVEIVVCTVLLSVVASVLVPGIRALSQQRKATRFDTLSLIELNNVATKLRHSEDVDVKVTSAFQSRYPDCDLAVERDANVDSAGLTSVRIELTRPEGDVLPATVRSLTIWLANQMPADDSQSSPDADSNEDSNAANDGTTNEDAAGDAAPNDGDTPVVSESADTASATDAEETE